MQNKMSTTLILYKKREKKPFLHITLYLHKQTMQDYLKN
jgi:hypothetical protein